MFFRKKHPSEVIKSAIGQFETLASQLADAANCHRAMIDANTEAIQSLHEHNSELHDEATRAESVAEKLRVLVS